MGLRRVLRRFLKENGRRVPDFLLRPRERFFRDIARQVGKGDIVIDLGAHTGEVSIECALRGATVHAFEPHPEIFKLLVKATSNYPGIITHNAAASDSNTQMKLYFGETETGKPYQGSTLVTGKHDLEYQNFHTVECTDLSEFIRELDQPVRLIKMDVEGMEYRIIEGLLRSGAIERVEKLHVECHAHKVEGLGVEKEKVLKEIAARGFERRFDFDWP